jgi:hypothetical protein
MVTGQDDPEDAAARLWKSGTELTGAVSGAFLGGAIGGPPGAILGAGAGSVIGSALKEFAHRLLGRRERIRIGATFQYASVAFQEQIDAGNSVRTDGFFSGEKGRSAADEAIEGVLIVAQREHEERKVEYLGYLLANLAFEQQVDRSLANWAIKMAEELTWAQLVLLAMVGAEDVKLPEIEIGKGSPNWNSFGIHEQLADLGYARREMIYGKPDKTPRLGLSKVNLSLSDQKLARGGVLMHELMWLNRIPGSDRAEILKSLAGEG